MDLLEGLNGDDGRWGVDDFHGVAQRAAEAFERDLHRVAIGQLDAVAEAQRTSSVVVHVDVSRPPVGLELEVMLLDVPQAVAHLVLSGENVLRPKLGACMLDRHLACYRAEIAVENQLRPESTSADLRTREIQVVLL